MCAMRRVIGYLYIKLFIYFSHAMLYIDVLQTEKYSQIILFCEAPFHRTVLKVSDNLFTFRASCREIWIGLCQVSRVYIYRLPIFLISIQECTNASIEKTKTKTKKQFNIRHL